MHQRSYQVTYSPIERKWQKDSTNHLLLIDRFNGQTMSLEANIIDSNIHILSSGSSSASNRCSGHSKEILIQQLEMTTRLKKEILIMMPNGLIKMSLVYISPLLLFRMVPKISSECVLVGNDLPRSKQNSGGQRIEQEYEEVIKFAGLLSLLSSKSLRNEPASWSLEASGAYSVKSAPSWYFCGFF